MHGPLVVRRSDPTVDPVTGACIIKTEIIQLKYASPTNITLAIQNTLTDKRSKVVADVRTSQLVVLATEKELSEVQKLVERLDTITKQVLIEAKLMETTMNPSTIKGLDWKNTLEAQNIRFGNNGVPSADETPRNPVGRAPYNPYGQAPRVLYDTLRGFNPATAFLDADWFSAVLSFLNQNSEAKVLPPVAPGGRDPVPTSVTQGPDGAFYVSQLTGFPFWRGTSNVLRIASDGSTTEVYASGFTAVVDLAVGDDKALYALVIATGQVAPFPPPSPGLGVGRLVRQCPGGTPEVLLAGLTFAAGVALGPDGAVYLTNKGTSATAGEVLRLSVTPCP